MITIPMTIETDIIEVDMTVGTDYQDVGMSIGAEYTMIEGDPYEGTYEVTPRVYAQSLETEGKLMSDDVTIYEIPVTKTSNPHGGLTVLIG